MKTPCGYNMMWLERTQSLWNFFGIVSLLMQLLWSRPKVGTQGKELDLLLVFDTDLKIFCGWQVALVLAPGGSAPRTPRSFFRHRPARALKARQNVIIKRAGEYFTGPGIKAQYRHLTIPWQVALPQSLLPLGQVILHYFHSRLFQIFLCIFWLGKAPFSIFKNPFCCQITSVFVHCDLDRIHCNRMPTVFSLHWELHLLTICHNWYANLLCASPFQPDW